MSRTNIKKTSVIALFAVLLGGLGVSASNPLAVPFSLTRAVAAPLQGPPPTTKSMPPEDAARYSEWLVREHKTIKGSAREDVRLRISDWGFFQQELRPGYFWDRAALDHSGHVITSKASGDWYSFLNAEGLDGPGALKRIAWLFPATGIEPASPPPKLAHRDKITAPTLTTKDGTIIFQGWFALWRGEFPPDMNDPRRITIAATATGAKMIVEAVKDIK